MAKQKESLTRQVASQYIDDTVIDFDRKLEVIGLAEPWLLTANAADLAADKNSFYRASLTYKAEGVARLNDVGMAELLDKCRTLSNLYNLSVHIPQGDLIVQKEALSNDHVTVFRRKMFEIACQRLDANRAELDAMQARYEAYFGKSKGSQRNDTCFEQLRNAIEKDKELQRRDETLCIEQGDAFDKLKNAPDYQPFIDNLQTIKDFRSDIANSRYLIRKAFPELDSVSGERVSYKTNNAQILEKMIKSFDRARKAQDEVRAKIDSGDMPLYKLDPIVDATKAFYGITDKSTDEFGKAVNAWLASERSKDCVIKILSTVVSLGLAAACFIPGIGIGAIIALGAIGAGVGMAGAIYEFEMADDLNDAGESQRSGSSKIVADADAARKEYVWGIVNICLASVDLFLSGAEVIRVGKVLSKFDTAADGSRFLNSVGNAKDTMTFLNRMDSLPNGRQVIQKLDKATGDTANEVVRFFNGLDEDILEKGTTVFNKFESPDDFIDAIGKVKKSYFEGTKKVKATGEIRDISRDVYQRTDIDWGMIVPGEKMTNLEWALKGNAPRGIDGYQIELHHFTQEEPGVIIEMLYTKHDQYTTQLHGLVENGKSFRRTPVLKQSYESFHSKYWIQRAKEVVKSGGGVRIP
jgi:hypothetical protein